MKIKTTIAVGIALLMSAGAAHAQEPRAVGVDEAALFARVLKAEVQATDTVFRELTGKHGKDSGDQVCAEEADEIRALIHEATYMHFEIRERYDPKTAAGAGKVGLMKIRGAGAMIAKCGGPRAQERIAQYTISSFNMDLGQSDLLTYQINRRNTQRADEKQREEAGSR